jgi:hypothetical protein
MTAATITKTKEAPKGGQYKPTSIDQRKADADFLLISTSPNVIKWRNGVRQNVSKLQLRRFQEHHPNWMTDF